MLAWTLIALGALPALLLLAAELYRRRATEPYAGIGRWAPELQAVLALFTGAGVWIGWGWMAGVGAFLGHAVVGIFLMQWGTR